MITKSTLTRLIADHRGEGKRLFDALERYACLVDHSYSQRQEVEAVYRIAQALEAAEQKKEAAR